jgi:hypothetical protein
MKLIDAQSKISYNPICLEVGIIPLISKRNVLERDLEGSCESMCYSNRKGIAIPLLSF